MVLVVGGCSRNSSPQVGLCECDLLLLLLRRRRRPTVETEEGGREREESMLVGREQQQQQQQLLLLQLGQCSNERESRKEKGDLLLQHWCALCGREEKRHDRDSCPKST